MYQYTLPSTFRSDELSLWLLFLHSDNATKRTSISLRFMSVTAFVKCPQARKNSHTQASLQWLFITHLYALISLLSRTLLDNSSNSSRTYCSTNFTVQIIFTYIVKSLFYAVLLNLYFEKIVPKCSDRYGTKVKTRSIFIETF